MLGDESILQIQSNSWFTCAHLLAGGLWWWFGNGFWLHESCVQNRTVDIPGTDSHALSRPLSCFHSKQCQQFHHVSSMDIPTYYAIGPLHWTSPVQPRGFSHQQVHHFRLAHPVSRNPRVFRLGTTADIRTDPFQYHIPLKLIASTDCRIWQVMIKTCRNLCFNLFHSSHWLTWVSKTWMNSTSSCFNMFQTRSALRWSWQRHAPKSRLLNFKGTLKTGTWDDKSREIPCLIEVEKSELTKCH